MQRLEREPGRRRRLTLSRETLLDLEPSDEQTVAVRGGSVDLTHQIDNLLTWARPCGPIEPAKQTVPPTGDAEDCPPPKKGDRYKVVHTTTTEFTYSVVEVFEGEDTTVSFVVEEVKSHEKRSPTELIPPTG